MPIPTQPVVETTAMAKPVILKGAASRAQIRRLVMTPAKPNPNTTEMAYRAKSDSVWVNQNTVDVWMREAAK